MSDRYHRRTLLSARLDRDRALAWLSDRSEAAEVAAPALAFLEGWVGGRTLAEQAERVLRAPAHGVPLPRDAIVRALVEMADAGLLISERALLKSMAEREKPGEEVPMLAAWGVVTRDRPEAVGRCVRTFSAHLQKHRRDATCTVIDSSPADSAARTESALMQSAPSGSELWYAGVKEKAAFAEELARVSGVDSRLTRFALLDDEHVGRDTGTNRNALLLAHAGAPFLSVDDDVLCDVRHAADPEDRMLNLSFRGEATSTILFQSFDEARASMERHEACIFEIHERLLGATLSACIRDIGPEHVDLEGPSPDTIELLLAGGGRVGATFTGITGDCGTASPAFYLYSNRIDPAKLPREETAYRRLAATRQVVSAVRRATITSSPTLMTTSFALDGRTFCPPFFPVGRGQDLLFGQISRRCFPDCFFGHLPVTTSHLPTDSRAIDPARLWWFSPHGALFQIVRLAVEIAGTGIEVAAWGAPRLGLFGRRLVELASLPWVEFERFVRSASWESAERAVLQIESLVRAVDPSHPWARDARAFAKARLSALAERDHLAPRALEQGRSPELARDLLLRVLRRYGELMVAWPEMFDAAKHMRERGAFMGRRLPS